MTDAVIVDAICKQEKTLGGSLASARPGQNVFPNYRQSLLDNLEEG